MDVLLIFLEPSLMARVAAESFEFDPTRTLVPPLDGLNVPELGSAMLPVDAELRAGGVGGPLLAESLATILSVHLIRHITGPRRLRGPKPFLHSLQADRRRHARTVSDFRKNLQKVRKLRKELGRRILLVFSSLYGHISQKIH
jgi:hypothetical protein